MSRRTFYFMAYFLVLWRTFWCYVVRYDVMLYVLMLWRSFDVMAYFLCHGLLLMLRCTFWCYGVLFDVMFYVLMLCCTVLMLCVFLCVSWPTFDVTSLSHIVNHIGYYNFEDKYGCTYKGPIIIYQVPIHKGPAGSIFLLLYIYAKEIFYYNYISIIDLNKIKITFLQYCSYLWVM